MRVDRTVRRWAVVLAVLGSAAAPAPAAVATPPSLVGAAPVTSSLVAASPAASGEPTPPPEPGQHQPEAITEAERAVRLAEPALAVIEVRWQGYVHDRATGQVIDSEPVSATIRCTGAGVGQKGYLVTTRSCLRQSAVAEQAFQQIVDRRLAAGVIAPSQAPDLLAELLLTATIGTDPDGDPPERSVFVRRAVTEDEPMPASVVAMANPVDGDAALVKIARNHQPVLPLASDADLAIGTELVTVEGPAALDDVLGVAGPVDPDDERADADAPIRLEFRTGTVRDDSPAILVEPLAPAPTEVLPAGVVLTHEAALAGLVDTSGPTGDRLVGLEVIRGLLTEAEIDSELGQVDRDYRTGVDAYYAGRYSDAIARFDAVLAIIPAHVQAHRYRDAAQRLRDAQGSEAPAPTDEVVDQVESWLGGRSWSLVGLVVLVAIVVFVLHWRRPPAEEPDLPGGGDQPARDPAGGSRPAHGEGSRPNERSGPESG
jgi:serine protease Do